MPIINTTMRVDSSVARILAEAAGAPEALKQSLQVATLKKALDSQKQEASQILKLLEPKGRVIDIRV